MHAKSHGLLRGTLRVLDRLPPDYAQGLFAADGEYPVVLRLSTTPGDLLDDKVSTPRGIAIIDAAEHIVRAAPSIAGKRAKASAAYNLDADVTRVMKTFDVPGIAIAIVKDSKVVATRGFGVRKLGNPAPVDAKTLFEVASNSKAFTAAALAIPDQHPPIVM